MCDTPVMEPQTMETSSSQEQDDEAMENVLQGHVAREDDAWPILAGIHMRASSESLDIQRRTDVEVRKPRNLTYAGTSHSFVNEGFEGDTPDTSRRASLEGNIEFEVFTERESESAAMKVLPLRGDGGGLSVVNAAVGEKLAMSGFDQYSMLPMMALEENGDAKVKQDDGAVSDVEKGKDASQSGDDGEDDTEDLSCGWMGLRPKCLRVFNNPKGYFFVLCMLGLLQNMTVLGYLPIVITTLERRFRLTSVQSSFIVIAYDISNLIVCAFVSYFGERGRKPVWVGLASILYSVGSVIFALPHWLAGPYEYGITQDDVCPAFTNTTSGNPCDDVTTSSDESMLVFYWMFIIGQVMHGWGGTSLYTVGVTYLDESITSSTFGLYMGIFTAVNGVGPAIGFIIGGAMLSDLYTDISTPISSLDITPDNPVWVGAWWLGFVINAALIFFFAILNMGFPKKLPGMIDEVIFCLSSVKSIEDYCQFSRKYLSNETELEWLCSKLDLIIKSEIESNKRVSAEILQQKKDESQAGCEFECRDGSYIEVLQDFPKALLTLLKNVPFMFLNGIAAFEWFAYAGISTFGPKFFESQLNISAGDASYNIGIITVSAGIVGSLISGVLMKRLNLSTNGMLKLSVACASLSLGVMFVFLFPCPEIPFAGVTVPYGNTQSTLNSTNISAPCHGNCACPETFDPVCGEDNILYYSACHAGCSVQNETSDGTITYQGCSCIANIAEVTRSPFIINGTAERGRCSHSCNYQWLYYIMLFLMFLFTSMLIVPTWTATVRCVDHSLRGLALGVQTVIYGGLGNVPGPVVFGLLIDRSCILWETSCDGAQSCWLYDNRQFAYYFFLLTVTCKAFVFIFSLGAIFTYKPADGLANANSARRFPTIAQRFRRKVSLRLKPRVSAAYNLET